MKKNLQLFRLLLLATVFLVIQVKGSAQSINSIPYAGARPSVVPGFGDVFLNTNSEYKSFTLFGTNLTADLTVGPIDGYVFSVTPDGIYTATVTVSPSAGRVNQYIYVKFLPNAVKAFNSNIPVTGGSAMSFNIAVSGTGIMNNSPVPPALTIIAVQLLATDENDIHSVDALKVVFNNKYSYGLGDEDSYKFINEGENIAINRNGKLLSIEGRPLVSEEDSLPLQITDLQSPQYSLKITGSGFSPLVSAVLKDNYLNTETPVSLSSTTVIPFAYDPASFSSNRFSIVLKTADLLPVTITNVKAYQKGKGVEIDWNAEFETNIEKYQVEKSVDGKQFENIATIQLKNNIASPQIYTCFDANVSAANNYYRIKIIERSGYVKYSDVVKVTINRGNNSISIFPNPVRGSVIGLHVDNLDKGDYKMSLYNNFGQSVYSGLIEHNGDTANYRVFLGRQISRGVYNLNISKGETLISRLIIVE